MEKVILPIKIQEDFNCMFWQALPLCVLKANHGYNDWIFENFINVHFLNPWGLFYINQFSKSLMYSCNLFQYEIIPYQIKSENIIKQIEERIINSNMYVYILLEEKFLPSKPRYYNKRSFPHPSLIYGCDPMEKTFFALTLGANEVIESICYTYDEVSDAYYEYININKDPTSESVIYFKIKTDMSMPPFSYENFLNNLIHYINGICYENHKMIPTAEFNTEFPQKGIHIYNTVIEKLKSKSDWNFEDFKIAHFLYEHKNNLLKSFSYLYENGFVDLEIKIYIEKYKNIFNDSMIIRNLFLKYLQLKQLHNDVERIKKRILNELENIKIKEQKILIEITEYLKKFKHYNKNSPMSYYDLKFTEESENLLNGASVEEVIKSGDSEYKYHNVYKIKWNNLVPLRHLQFIGKELIHTSADNKYLTSSNVLVEDEKQLRYVFIHDVCTEILLEVYSNNSICFSDLNLNVIRGSFAHNKKSIASSYWGDDEDESFSPDRILNYYDTFWNARKDCGGNQFVEVDLESEYKINRILIQEQTDRYRLREYRIEGYNLREDKFLLAGFEGCTDGKAIIHTIPDAYVTRLRLTITKTEADEWGFAEPNLLRFEAYYYLG